MIFLLFFLASSKKAAVSQASLDISVERIDDGLYVEITLPEPTVSIAQNRSQFSFTKMPLLNEPGLPQLPVLSQLVVLPADATPQIVVESLQETVRPLVAPLPIAPKPEGVLRDAAGNVVGGAFVDVPAQAHEFDVAAIEDVGIMRGVRLARITFFPIRPFSGGIKTAAFIRARIQFNSTLASFNSPNRVQDSTWETTLRSLVANPDDIARFTNMPQSTNMRQRQGGSSAFYIDVDTVGITAVSYAELSAAGFPVNSVDPQKMHLTRSGTPIAIQWQGDGDTQFESNESFLFYAEPRFSRWSTTDSYRLTVASTDGLRIDTQSAAPDSLPNGRLFHATLVEDNQQYSPECFCGSLPFGRDGDRWMWDDLRLPGWPSKQYDFSLNAVDSSQPATLTLWMVGFTELAATPDHLVEIDLNGSSLPDSSWDGRTAITSTVSISAGTLSGSNSLTLTLPGQPGVSIDGVWLDAFQIDYVGGNGTYSGQVQFRGEASASQYDLTLTDSTGLLAYNISNPATPIRLTETVLNSNTLTFGDANSGDQTYQVAATANLLAPVAVRAAQELQTAVTSGADYLIIAPSDYLTTLTPLVQLRQSQGLTVAVESVAAIFDQVGDGRMTPESIRNFIQTAYSSWSPVPTAVMLVGDGTVDPKQYRDNSFATIIPPYLKDVDPWIGEVPADNRYVTVDGNDIVPDLLFGRLPVNSVDELATVVNKIVAYETDPHFGNWNARVLTVADNTDSAGNFAYHSDEFIDDYFAAPYIPRPIYYEPATVEVAQMQESIKLEWNVGDGIVMYNGHSSIHQWGTERFIHLDDVPDLQNGSRLPVVVQMTCLTGSFHLPGLDAFDEALLRSATGGAVSVWGATGLGVATGHDALANGFFTSLITDATPELGFATITGKLMLTGQTSAYNDLVDTFTLLGDPYLRFNYDFDPGFQLFLPLSTRN